MKVAIILVILILILYFFHNKNHVIDHFHVSNNKKIIYYDIISTPRPLICFIAGTHGNEPAGTNALMRLITTFHNTLKKGTIRIIPAVNVWGLLNSNRYTSKLGVLTENSDINRNYTGEGTEILSKTILNLIKNADMVVDFHEGWGYHKCQPSSIGSTINPTSNINAESIAKLAVKKINKNMNLKGCKEFSCLHNSCEISSTLSCNMETNNKPYILVETTGQNNIQPMETRIKQINIIIKTVLNYFDMNSNL